MKLTSLKQFKQLNSSELKQVNGGVSRKEYCNTLNNTITHKTSFTYTEIQSFAKALADHC
ncbi:bacteriocin [Aquimarina mytili]|uniref:Bacteriocin n=1 Tax=Aquimarina mytili TaxID=874423 RepID=A0A937D7S7_9FLAO|nr:bacteriocin [Aquimarina mytili]MBL0683380.1 bacteriocin [Aquimarina mytili]